MIAGAPRLIIDTSGPGGTLHVRTRPPLKPAIRDALTRGAGAPRDGYPQD